MSSKKYSQAGVNVDLGNRVKSGIQEIVGITHRPEVLGAIGGFGGLFKAQFKKFKDPILVGSIDGVGTKLKVAEMADRHDTIGEDLVNHCVNDIAVVGAEPLFFLDYIGTSKLEPARFKQILTGLARGCKLAGCALIGGETAQMPGLYHGKDYDLVGSIVGIVDRAALLDGKSIRPGDVLIGLPSSGLHTNGYSLARHILFDELQLTLKSKIPGLKGTLREALLAVHVNYLPLLRTLRGKVKVKGLAHITGGGLLDNLPRVLPKNVDARIDLGSWPIPPLFEFLVKEGKVAGDEPYQVFNMGIGMVVIVPQAEAAKALKLTQGYRIGEIVKGTRKVLLNAATSKK